MHSVFTANDTRSISEVSEAGSETEAPGHLEERKASADQPVIVKVQLHVLGSGNTSDTHHRRCRRNRNRDVVIHEILIIGCVVSLPTSLAVRTICSVSHPIGRWVGHAQCSMPTSRSMLNVNITLTAQCRPMCAGLPQPMSANVCRFAVASRQTLIKTMPIKTTPLACRPTFCLRLTSLHLARIIVRTMLARISEGFSQVASTHNVK